LELSIKSSRINENTLIWAIVCSILLHALLAITLPNFEFGKEKKTQELIIEIQQPKAPEPVAEVLPEKPKPIEPPKPEPIKKIKEPKLTPKPTTKTVEAPSPIQQIESTPNEVESPPQPNVIAIAPIENTTPTTTVAAPVAEPPKPVDFSQVELDNALGEYGNALGRAIAKQKQYPKIAQMRSWQGDVMLDLKLDGNGKVLSATVSESSGHETLDKQALEMVRKASPFPLPPLALRDRTFNIKVPVSFKLENP
jgi:periplasmic protein TonB